MKVLIVMLIVFFIKQNVYAFSLKEVEKSCQQDFIQVKNFLSGKNFLFIWEKKVLVRLFETIHGATLTCVKIKIDYDPEMPNLSFLVNQMLYTESGAFRKELLKHFKEEGETWQSLHSAFKGLVSDIDDTLFPGYYDVVEANKKGKIYEGVFAFHQHFDYLAIITARPFSPTKFKKIHNELSQKKVRERALYMGTNWGILSRSWRFQQKVFTFMKLIELYPEMNFSFVGDCGDKDIDVGLTIKEMFPKRIENIFIKRISNCFLDGDGSSIKYFKEYSELKF